MLNVFRITASEDFVCRPLSQYASDGCFGKLSFSHWHAAVAVASRVVCCVCRCRSVASLVCLFLCFARYRRWVILTRAANALAAAVEQTNRWRVPTGMVGPITILFDRRTDQWRMPTGWTNIIPSMDGGRTKTNQNSVLLRTGGMEYGRDGMECTKMARADRGKCVCGMGWDGMDNVEWNGMGWTLWNGMGWALWNGMGWALWNGMGWTPWNVVLLWLGDHVDREQVGPFQPEGGDYEGRGAGDFNRGAARNYYC